MTFTLRRIKKQDNPDLQTIFKTTLLELKCFESEYLSDPDELFDLHADYQGPRSAYYVAINDNSGELFGGGGYAPLAGNFSGICEVQKMYLSSAARGKGIGKTLLEKVIAEAGEHNFETLYLETMPNMTSAIKLYERVGFKRIPERMGSTGHNSCTIFMSRPV